MSTTVTPAAWPDADPHPGPDPGPPSSPAPHFPVAEVPLGVTPPAGSSASCFPLETRWKHGTLPRPRRQTRLPCDSAGLELGPATRCPNAPLRSLEARRAQLAGRWPLPPLGPSWTCLLPVVSEGPGPKSLEEPADPGLPCGCCQLALPGEPLPPRGASDRKRNNPFREALGLETGKPYLVPIQGNK